MAFRGRLSHGLRMLPGFPGAGTASAHASSAPRPGSDAWTVAVLAAADRLAEAARTSQPGAPVRDLIGGDDIGTAYAVQREVVGRRVAAGAVVVGRKIGLTSAAVQRQLDVHEPDFGVLLDDMDVSGRDVVPYRLLLQPRAEAEIAFVLARDLPADPDAVDRAVVEAAVEFAVGAIEIVDSRVADWDIHIADTVADNASGGLYVLGDIRLGLDEVVPREVEMTLSVDGEVVSSGRGTACLGDPVDALLWLARTAAAYGDPLRAGQVVLSGALGPIARVPPGAEVRAEMSSLGPVAVRFSSASATTP